MKNKKAKKGVGIVKASNILYSAIQEKLISEKLLTVKIKLVDDKIQTIITTYGKNKNARNKKNIFFKKIIVITIIENLNEKIGNKNVSVKKLLDKKEKRF